MSGCFPFPQASPSEFDSVFNINFEPTVVKIPIMIIAGIKPIGDPDGRELQEQLNVPSIYACLSWVPRLFFGSGLIEMCIQMNFSPVSRSCK